VPLVGTLRTRHDQAGWWVWGCFGTLLVAAVATQSRAAMVGLLVMVLAAVLTGLLALRYAGALVALVGTAAALLVAVLPVPVGAALSDPQRYADTNVAQRNEFRLAALEMTRDSPVIGLGPAAYAVLHEGYRAFDPEERDPDSAYSTVLEASAELGVVGAVALYAVWVVPLTGLRRRRRSDRSRLVGGVLLALTGLLATSLLESAQLLLPLWFLAAMALALGRPRPRRDPVLAGLVDPRSSGQPGPES
jgi:O-antigen ligase